jgi:cytochrome c peroxidase
MVMKLKIMPLGVVSVTATPLLLCAASATALEPIELLGKSVFFDESLSIPGNKQACASCHDPAKGWTLPNSNINNTTVVAPGAKAHALGSIKAPTNAYAFFSPPFDRDPNANPPWVGGNFWDGRAEGCGAKPPFPPACTVLGKPGAASKTITPSDVIGVKQDYTPYLGPTADQALNPFPNDVEQNIREKNVCQRVKTAKYKDLYVQAYGAAIDCSPNPTNAPAYSTSFKRIAVALAAYQASDDVSPFKSKRDRLLNADADHKFPLIVAGENTDQINLGHDLFYNRNDSGLNPNQKRANCRFCHNGVKAGTQPDPDPAGNSLFQLYTDNRYRNIGVPFNREIPGVAKLEKVGLAAHVDAADGAFKTPTMRNVAKGASANFIKAYTHNGWFKSLKHLVHFYNTRDEQDPADPIIFKIPRCETLNIFNATEKETLNPDGTTKCWPAPEFAGAVTGIIGKLKLTSSEEDAIVAYLESLSDEVTASRP